MRCVNLPFNTLTRYKYSNKGHNIGFGFGVCGVDGID